MPDGSSHAQSVDAWLEASDRDRSPEQRVALFEAAATALWSRSRVTLGEITLAAIADRVIYRAAEEYPAFEGVQVEPTGALQLDALRERAAAIPPKELAGAIRFVLVEFLTVLGNLTAEVLTHDLHATLSKVSLAEAPKP